MGNLRKILVRVTLVIFLKLLLGVVISGGQRGGEDSTSQPQIYKLGGILSDNASHIHFNTTLAKINQDPLLGDSMGQLAEVTMIMDSNPIRTALEVCNKLVASAVYAVVVSHPTSGDLSPAAVSYTSGFYHIPVIGISSRDSAFSDKNIHVSFLRTVPPYSHQADVWVQLLKTFQYTQVVFIYSSDTDGRALLGRFRNNAQNHEDDKDIKEELAIEFEPGLNTFVDKLKAMREASARVILLYANKDDARMIFHDAAYFEMTGEGYIWIVTEQALGADHVPVGTIGLRLVNASNENAHITDSLYVIAMALKKLREEGNATSPPQDCNNAGNTWDTGKHLFKHIREQILNNGLTGKVAFDDHGDRINAEYDIINVQEVNISGIVSTKEEVVGQFVFNTV